MLKFTRPRFESAGRHRRLTFLMPDKPEVRRCYTFPGGDVVELLDVQGVSVSAHGNHLVRTGDGMVHVIPWGWICLTYPGESNVKPEEEK